MKNAYEKQYMDILKDIRDNGFEQKNERTGVATRRIPHAVICVDLQKEFPILKKKQVFWKSAIEEILWTMQKQSNNIKDLRPHIWDQWADENGSIGKAYGYQVKMFKQVDYVLDRLAKDSSDRRAVIDLWNAHDLAEMNLVPCCYTSVWNIINGKLNCLLTQRSADFPVGVPFNTTQYAALTHLFARHLGVVPGQLTHVMADAHIYVNQLDGVNEMIRRFEESPINTAEPCQLVINSDEIDFYKQDIANITVKNYAHMGKIDFPVTA